MNNLISIIIPVYNVENYLEKCIESVINQTYKNIEIILVDDGSTDSSGIICDKYASLDSRIMVIHKKNGGLSDARNFGIDKCNGKYISFVDSDDYISDKYIEILYKNLIDNDADISICDFIKFNEKMMENNTYSKKIFVIEGEKKYEYLYNEYMLVTTVQWNKLFKKEIFNNITFSKGKINEDDFIIADELFFSNRISYIMEPLYFYYQRSNSIMNTFGINRFQIIEGLDNRIEMFKRNNLEQFILKTKVKQFDTLLFLLSLSFHHKFADKDNVIINKYKERSIKLGKSLLKSSITLKERIKIYIYMVFPNLLLKYILKRC